MYFCILKEALYYSEDYCNGIDLETTLWFMLFRTSCFDKQQTRTHSCCNSHSRYYSHLYQNFDRNFLLKFIMSLVFSLQTIVLLTYSWHSFSQYHSHLYSLHIINYMFFILSFPTLSDTWPDGIYVTILVYLHLIQSYRSFCNLHYSIILLFLS